MAEHQVTCQVMGQLVNGGCGKPVPRMQAPDKTRCEQQSPIVMNGGITKVGGDGAPAVLCVNALEVLRYVVKSFLSSKPFPTIRSATNGILEAVFIEVKISQGSGLRADVPAAERVVFVTADVKTLVGLNCDFDAADRFAEIAGAIVKGTIGGGSHSAVQICVIDVICG